MSDDDSEEIHVTTAAIDTGLLFTRKRVIWSLGAVTLTSLLVLVGIFVTSFSDLVLRLQNVSYWAPATIALISSAISVMGRRRASAAIYYIVCFGWIIAGGLAMCSIVISAIDFASIGPGGCCEEGEIENANKLTYSAIRISLNAVLMLSLFSNLRFVWYARLDSTSDYEKKLHTRPGYPKLTKFIKGFTKVITACCTPTAVNKQMINESQHVQHTYHHVIQLIYEIILLITAIAKTQYLHLVAIGSGLVGSLSGVLGSTGTPFRGLLFVQVEVILNGIAVIISLFVTAIEILNVKCAAEANEDMEWLIYLFLFAIIADSIRLNATLHGFVELNQGIWDWMTHSMAEIEWKRPPKHEKKALTPVATTPVRPIRKSKVTRRSLTILGLIIAILGISLILVGLLYLKPGIDMQQAVKMTCLSMNITYVQNACETWDDQQGNAVDLIVDVGPNATYCIYHGIKMRVEKCILNADEQCTDPKTKCYAKGDTASYYVPGSSFDCWYYRNHAWIYKPWLPIGGIVAMGMIGLVFFVFFFVTVCVYFAYRRQNRDKDGLSDGLLQGEA